MFKCSRRYTIYGYMQKGGKMRLHPPLILLVVEMFESTPLFKFHLHRKDIGENLTSWWCPSDKLIRSFEFNRRAVCI